MDDRRHMEIAFEAGDTLNEFVRVIAETGFRRGFEMGFATAVAFKNENDKALILRAHRMAREVSPTIDIHWEPDDDLMYLVVDEPSGDHLPIIGVSARTYEVLELLEITREKDDDA